IKTQTRHNPNPRDGEAYHHLGVCLRYQQRIDEAYDAFHKAAWNAAWQDSALFQLAQIAALRGDLPQALEYVDSSLARNGRNQKATHLKVVLLRKLGRSAEALRLTRSALVRDPLDFGARNELALLGRKEEHTKLLGLMGGNAHCY